jgi:hypothetical protein
MLRHASLTFGVAVAALVAAIHMIPGPREQWTMLVRDERNDEALAILEQRYEAGERDPEAMLQFYKLLMSVAKIDRATRIIEEIASHRPDDTSGLAELAKHYGHTQDLAGETRTLERLFALQPSSTTAQRLLVLYRLRGDQPQEQRLLAKMLPTGMTTAEDTQRLGFMLAAKGDFQGALEALLAFDSVAAPEYSTSRFALVDVLLRLGQPENAMAKMQHWLVQWEDDQPKQDFASLDFPLDRLIRLMAHVDRPEARRIVCASIPELSAVAPGTRSPLPPICAPTQAATNPIGIDPEDFDLPSVAAARAKAAVATAARRVAVAKKTAAPNTKGNTGVQSTR